MQTNSFIKKFFVTLSFCLVLAIALCACESNKTSLGVDDFISKADSSGLLTENNTAQYKEFEHIVSVITAGKIDNSSVLWKTDFMVAKSEDNAIGMFESNKENFEKVSGASASTSTSIGNFNSYQKTGNGKYMYLCRVDKTLLYANVDEKYKDEFRDFVDKLGY